MLKRLFDILLASILIVILFPVMFFCWLLVRIKLGVPVIFIQERVGLNNTVFKLYKFRTMIPTRDIHGQFLPDAQRLTKLGKFLRGSSLDELPQLLNILKGEMSFVGPRPLLVEYLPLYNSEQRRRHNVKPGITGWAQINGRNALTWTEKFKCDVWYVENQSFLLDIKIFLLTFKKVITKDNINSQCAVTMEKFTGNNG